MVSNHPANFCSKWRLDGPLPPTSKLEVWMYAEEREGDRLTGETSEFSVCITAHPNAERDYKDCAVWHKRQ